MLLHWLLAVIILISSTAHALDNEPINPLPDSNSSQFRTKSRTYWQSELPDIMSHYYPEGFIHSGGTHPSSVSCTSAAFSTEAFTSGGNRVRATSDNNPDTAGTGVGGSGAINYTTTGCDCTGSDAAWVIISGQTGASLGNFTRASGTNYFINCTDSLRPTLPADSSWLMFTPMSGGALGTPTDIRIREPGAPPAHQSYGDLTEYGELRHWWGDSALAHVTSGCTHPISGTTSATTTIPCNAFTKDAGLPSSLTHVTDPTARLITYSDGDGDYWLALSPDISGNFTDWTRVQGTHYLTRKLSTHPISTNNLLIVQKSTVSGGAITVVDPTIAPHNFYDFDRVVYFTKFGMICDGITDNTTAMQNAVAALPPTGGTLVIPASRFSCPFSTTFAPGKSFTLNGSGGEGTARVDSPVETMLEYTGSGVAIEMGSLSSGSVLQGFGLNNTGTGTAGIRVTGGNNHRIRGISIVTPTVKFSIAGIEFAIGAGHSHTIDETIIRDAAPSGVLVRGGIAIKITDSAIHHHEVCNVEIGDILSSPVKDFHIFHSRMELNTVHATTDAVSLCTRNVEKLHVTESHFELGASAVAVMRIGPTDKQCEQCFFQGNFVSLLSNANLALQTTGIFVLDAPGAVPAMYLKVTDMRINDTRTAGALLSLFNIGNTSGNGGVGNLILKDNEIPFNVRLDLINDESRINGSFEQGGNWALGSPHFDHNVNINQCLQNTAVGNIGAGVDNLMAGCTIVGRRMVNGGGFRATIAGKTASNAANKQIKALWNSILVWDSGVVAANDVAWRVECNGILANAGAMSIFCQGNPLTTTTLKTTYTDVTVNFATSPIWQVTGESVTTNDIVQLFQMVELTKK